MHGFHSTACPWRLAIGLFFLALGPVAAEDNWLLGSRWVEVGRPCALTRDGRVVANGVTYGPDFVMLRMPAEFEPPFPPARLPARYEVGPETIVVDLEGQNGAAYRLVLRRDGAFAVDASGFRYRQCAPDAVS